MARVFNLGLGMVAIVPAADAAEASEVLAAHGGSYVVGRVIDQPGGTQVTFE
jgi:phosphoribosylaminoimidazole (AIR) synthetase